MNKKKENRAWRDNLIETAHDEIMLAGIETLKDNIDAVIDSTLVKVRREMRGLTEHYPYSDDGAYLNLNEVYKVINDLETETSDNVKQEVTVIVKCSESEMPELARRMDEVIQKELGRYIGERAKERRK